MKIGFTGTRDGMTTKQKAVLGRLLAKIIEETGIDEFHQGDCKGADNEAWGMVVVLGKIKTVSHPPSCASCRTFTKCDETRKPKPFLDRNKDIVNETDVLIVCPMGEEVVRSGTWSTFRHAVSCKKPIHIIMPNGEVRTND